MMDFINIWLSSFRKIDAGKTRHLGNRSYRACDQKPPHYSGTSLGNAVEAMQQTGACGRQAQGNAAVLDESDLDLSSKLRLSLTTAPDAQSPM
ncbi:hypothetical protein [Bradyrhizobium septentrionale]|uniref:Uncharacterized protein n=1 Tax=Bradyrhizobium septentrionale TaxID=1404411 RepID=A0A973W5B1_9BRAD|nr:hypothetical protein [Bradyrhizobium septentrionale]UGY16577.1 hypothetical protein HAP48_0003195 [Bradyrhizobium septentrionale]UGY25234.1 hypothetical protein HU675_0046555 [Bradyrhizobium septentrionale]